MNQITLSNYDIPKTLFSGQTFSWEFNPKTEIYTGIFQDKVIKLKVKERNLFWQTYPEKDNFDYLSSYLRLEDDYENIIESISIDEHTKEAIKMNRNLRLLKQDFEITLFSFIMSQHKNIKAIKKCFDSLRGRYGNTLKVDNENIKLFPKSEVLDSLTIDELLLTGVGFRAKYLKDAARILTETNLSKSIHSIDELAAREELKKIIGVGDKIADCVLTFSLGFNTTTPIDIWGDRIIRDLYKIELKKYSEKREWFYNKFRNNTSWAGQYLFEYIRMK